MLSDVRAVKGVLMTSMPYPAKVLTRWAKQETVLLPGLEEGRAREGFAALGEPVRVRADEISCKMIVPNSVL